MAATVVDHVYLAVGVAHHDYGLARDVDAIEIAGVGHEAVVTNIKPRALEDALHLELEDLRVGIDAAMNAILFDQAAYVVGRIGHGLFPVSLINGLAPAFTRRT